MQLLGDIINELIDSSQSLEGPLLKTKVLASRLKNTALITWVDKELEGYNLQDDLPDYRVYKAQLSMDYIIGFNQVNNQPVPVVQLSYKVAETLRNMEFFQSVASLQTNYSTNKSGSLLVPIPAELIALIQDSIQRMSHHNADLQILALRKSMPVTILTQILASIRKRLLDFMLKIEDEFGEITDIVSLREKNQQITTIMNTTINNNGHGNVINTGNQANIQATINIQQGDFGALAAKLRENGVLETDIAELSEVINNDDVIDRESNRFGPRVNGWIHKMIGKALDGSWQIATGAAGGLLVELIKAYYGMGN